MNEVIKTLEERRSYRKYQDKMVPKEDIEEIIEAGLYAASGMGRQSAIILAVTDKETRDMLSKANAAVMKGTNDPFYGAPVVLVVLADKNVPTHVYDGALVMGNLMNAASSKGIASCWIHRAKEVMDSEEGKALLKKLGVEGEYEGIGNLILGYPEGDAPVAKERREGRVYWVE